MDKMLLLLFLGLAAEICSGLDNGLARTPPMGWLSWERFRCETDCTTFPDSCISEKLYMAMADKMVELNLKAYGYEYVNIDDCWPAKERDPETGKLVADPDRFPSGISALADYMHARGLKLGIYEDFGVQTCAKYPGSEFYMEIDANTFAEWKVDMVKFDGCNSDPNDSPYGYPTMQFYMNKTGHPMLYSCEWPLYESKKHDYPLIRKTCNMWRNYGDVTDSWESVTSIIHYFGNNPQNFSTFTGPGGWADPDMLVVGDFGLSYYQQKAQFGMWAMFAAPIFMSVDLRTITQEALAILKSKDVIAINQDPLGIQALRLYATDYALIRKTCNTWRNSHDVQDTWDSVLSIIDFYGDDNQNFSAYTGPGGWADPDMLVVGDFGLSYYQQKAQFGMWAMFSAPLLMSVDLRTISQEALAILQNRNVIAINQDPLGVPAKRLDLQLPNSISVWTKPLADGSTAVAFYQEGNSGRPTLVSTTLATIGLASGNGYNVTEVFDGKGMGTFKPSSPFKVLVDPNGILLLKAKPM
ncbi:alpha-N-acetylgalactosaminidase-like [Littorina saxatilis]|uniref:alpha-N-acetylgalactosaminidase-like n=1 Tax=Littorina saxatilis TaxID=31220 RepID=UPI0038B43B98